MFESDHPTLADLQRYHRELDAAKGFYVDLYFNALLLQEEVGEVSSVVAQVWRDEQRTGSFDAALAQQREPLAEELADCLAYLVKLANYAGIDLEAAYLVKMRRNLGREWRSRGENGQPEGNWGF
jgi:NTP pyrophosphatase (non-canonical NTP hydrolase)